MNVLVERAEARAARAYTEHGRETASCRSAKGRQTAEPGGFVLDISGAAMDNNSAYAGHGRSIEDVMQEAGGEDVTARRNYMAIMSGTVSDEDFARLWEEGFHPGSTDIETVVTIVDRMKAALAMGGTEIAGYTDTVSDDALKNIAGSEAFANELKKQFSEKDLPLTEENIAAVTEAWNILTKAGEPTDGSMKYMVENDLEPTAENLYTARYSAAADGSRQGRGYYEAGSVAGYYARKPDEIDFEKLRPQMEKIIEEAGYRADEEKLEDARWLVEKGIPLNAETFSLLSGIKGHKFPVSVEDFITVAASALADGISPAKADLGRKESYLEQAAALAEETASIDERAADIIQARDLPLTLKNLLAAREMLSPSGRGREESFPENLHGRRLLEEVRLSMTIEANLKLLRSGFQIETAPLEELVAKLKEAEESFAKALTGEVEESGAKEKISLYQETLEVVQGIKSSPVSIVAQVYETDTLREVYAHGSGERRAFERAGLSYETMMTQPRRDMGDSIQKAFRNVDDILESMNLEASEANRRAVRILGYNSLEITAENIRQIREKDELLRDVVEEMKPGRVLGMIREGVNPLAMNLGELGSYFGQQEDTAEQMESYSRFLYKLEKQKGITEEEKSAYIGIYRLVRQIEKADDAAVGALWQTGAEFTLGNLLSALRSSRRGGMDYSVDDQFGGVNARKTGRESITGQIEKGYRQEAIPEKQELEQLLEGAGSDEAGREFDHMLYEQVRGAVKSEEEVLKYLTDYGKGVSADHLLAAEKLLKNPKEVWRELNRLKKQEDISEQTAVEEGEEESSLEDMGEEVFKALEDRESAQRAYDGLEEVLRDMIEKMAFSDSHKALDVRAMSTLYKQITFMGSMAREENYEIPVRIGGSLTSINLKILHKGQKESKAAIAFDSAVFGRTTAEFQLTGQGLKGFCTCSVREGAEFLKEHQESLREKFRREEIEAGEIYFAAKESLSLTEFSLRESDRRQAGDDSKLLYRAARAFIEYVQETGLKKGNTEYENQL